MRRGSPGRAAATGDVAPRGSTFATAAAPFGAAGAFVAGAFVPEAFVAAAFAAGASGASARSSESDSGGSDASSAFRPRAGTGLRTGDPGLVLTGVGPEAPLRPSPPSRDVFLPCLPMPGIMACAVAPWQ